MSVTEERTRVEAPVERTRNARWWMGAVIGVVALVLGVAIGILVDGSDEDTSDLAGPALIGEPSANAVDIAERWGRAWETGDSDAVRALYSSDIDERYIVDQTHRAVWRDVDAAIDQINSVNNFERFELVRLEEFPTSVVAEYEVQWADGQVSSLDQNTVVVVFIGPQEESGEGLIVGSDIYVMPWSDIFGVDYEVDYSLGNGAWVVIE